MAMNQSTPKPARTGRVLLALLAQVPLVVAVLVSLEANRMAREQLERSAEALHRAYAPLLAAENPDLREVYEQGEPSHFDFFVRIFNLQPHPAYRVVARVETGDGAAPAGNTVAPVLYGSQVPEGNAQFLRSLAVAAELPLEAVARTRSGEERLLLVLEHEDSFGNRFRQEVVYRMAGSGKLVPEVFSNRRVSP